MKVLLDECVPCQMKRFLAGQVISTVQEMGWTGIRNSTLLALAEQHHFDVFVTADKNIPYQQSIRGRSFGLVGLPTNILPVLQRLAAEFSAAVARVKPGQHVQLALPES